MGSSGTETTAASAGMTTLMIARGWRQCGQRCWLPGVATASALAVHVAVLRAGGHLDDAAREASSIPRANLLPEERTLLGAL